VEEGWDILATRNWAEKLWGQGDGGVRRAQGDYRSTPTGLVD
jgi:hypothetical protein